MTAQARTPSLVVALADDLSGAVETAAALLRTAGTSSMGVRVALNSQLDPRAVAQVVDLDLRELAVGTARRRVQDALDSSACFAHVFLKIDSQLRGNVAACVEAVLATGRVPVVAPALPALGRTVVGGAVRVHGRALADTPTWRAEDRPAPELVADVLTVPVLGARPGAAPEEFPTGTAVVLDTASDADLDLVAATFLHRPDVVLVGSAGLAGAVGRVLPASPHVPSPPPAAPRTVLVVVGTAEPVARRQVDLLAARHDVQVLELGAGPKRLREALAAGTTVLRGPLLRGPSEARPAQEMARSVAAVAHDPGTALVLLGGQTARLTCEELGIDALVPHHQVHHGAVVCTAPDGRVVVVRPGSFGDDDALFDVLRAIDDLARETLPREALT